MNRYAETQGPGGLHCAVEVQEGAWETRTVHTIHDPGPPAGDHLQPGDVRVAASWIVRAVLRLTGAAAPAGTHPFLARWQATWAERQRTERWLRIDDDGRVWEMEPRTMAGERWSWHQIGTLEGFRERPPDARPRQPWRFRPVNGTETAFEVPPWPGSDEDAFLRQARSAYDAARSWRNGLGQSPTARTGEPGHTATADGGVTEAVH